MAYKFSLSLFYPHNKLMRLVKQVVYSWFKITQQTSMAEREVKPGYFRSYGNHYFKLDAHVFLPAWPESV